MTTELEPGSLLRGKYRVVRLLGQGGMGRVIEAQHLDLDRRVAVKVLHPELRSNSDLVDRFLREGRAAAKIEGEHVARVLDVDRLDDGTPFLVMEFLEGHDLSAVRRSRSPLPIADAIEYVLQACTAIKEAHERGIIHRDIKPANLFLTHSRLGAPCVKVLDFGISKVSGPLDGSEPSLTKTSLVMGSAEFMSPEQMLSTRNVDVRTDIWALGVVLYELLTALPPFVGENMTQVCAMVMSQSPPTPRSLRPEVSEQLECVVLRCLEKDRTARFPTVAALVSALTGARDASLNERPHMAAPTPRMSPSGAPPSPFLPAYDSDAGPATAILPETDPELRALTDSARQLAPMSQQPHQHSPTALSGSLTNVPVSSELSPPPRNAGSGKVIAIGAALALLVGGFVVISRQLSNEQAASRAALTNTNAAAAQPRPASADAAAARSSAAFEVVTSAPARPTVVVEPATTDSAPTQVASLSARASARPTAPPPATATGKTARPPVATAKPKKPNGID